MFYRGRYRLEDVLLRQTCERRGGVKKEYNYDLTDTWSSALHWFTLFSLLIFAYKFVERKNLNVFLKEVNSKHFIQIHKSFVVNKQWVKNIQGQECILKNSETLPIGRRYKSVL